MQLQNKSMVQEFTLYHLVVIDVILQMDWLSKNYVIIDCNKKKVYLVGDMACGKKLFFRDEKVENQSLPISYFKATNYLQKGCQGFLFSVLETPKESKEADLYSMRIVSKFLNVFPEELAGLPRSLQNGGDYYCIQDTLQNGPVGLQERKVQLKQLLDKIFIDLVSHLGEHQYFS